MGKPVVKEVKIELDMSRLLITNVCLDGKPFPYQVFHVGLREDFQSVTEVTLTIPCERIEVIKSYGDHDDKKD